MSTVHLVECPRDAMQGWPTIIPVEQKIEYLNSLLRVGFQTLDFGSFVSPKAIPQMADTRFVLPQLELHDTKTELLAIVANVRGALDALEYEQIRYLGFPFSVSETFQQRNTNSSIQESLATVAEMQTLCVRKRKKLVVYLSMGFGNPYGDEWNEQIVFKWAEKLVDMGITIISLADTVGLATADQVGTITGYLIKALPDTEIGVHLHSTPFNWQEKVDAALQAGCLRFDGALKGIGGCPMADDVLVGNMNTELMIPYFESKGMLPPLDQHALTYSLKLADRIFGKTHR
ncbi:hydroxymethylglutaryl-CoA lyase [Pseudoflavitalea sp. G-6-1-2]|uniref:hydroxymethylglutaryl-CoA lyase n=1 Tax=Pseudoflavitalea sp. G-6-1-2 TaxID=2728841 RepID=UPI00146A9995|nr:hydroxymethylglutaryl-CoA lyase [Pseudoflavitalea sp. G-6-1-2]NML23732.1 hydroxymethylglutaryl-CoA lyase [Pseudoflavitalea sp. G-6-1-2]